MRWPRVCVAATASASVSGVTPCVVISTISFACLPAANADTNSMHSGSNGGLVLPCLWILHCTCEQHWLIKTANSIRAVHIIVYKKLHKDMSIDMG